MSYVVSSRPGLEGRRVGSGRYTRGRSDQVERVQGEKKRSKKNEVKKSKKQKNWLRLANNPVVAVRGFSECGRKDKYRINFEIKHSAMQPQSKYKICFLKAAGQGIKH